MQQAFTRQAEAAAIEEFRAFVRAHAQQLETAAVDTTNLDPAVRGSLPPTVAWSRFACLAVAGGPCPAGRLSQCHRNCWRRPKAQRAAAGN